MYVNKCIKCGAEFETKNPKRVICPNCLYAEKTEGGSDGMNKQSSMSNLILTKYYIVKKDNAKIPKLCKAGHTSMIIC